MIQATMKPLPKQTILWISTAVSKQPILKLPKEF